MARVEFHFDLSSPWTYLAFHNIQSIIAETGAGIRWIPFLVGGVFNAVNRGLYALREDSGSPKMRHVVKSLNDWSQWSGVEIHFPSKYHPVRSVHAMRACCVLEEDQETLVRFARAAFQAYFGKQQNLDDPAVLEAIADGLGLGLDGASLLVKSQSDAIKARLRANTVSDRPRRLWFSHHLCRWQ